MHQLGPQAIRQLPTWRDQAADALRPCPAEHLAKHVATLGALLPSNREDFSAKVWQRAMLDALQHLPADLIDAAFAAARRSCKFLPTPAEVRAFVDDDIRERNRVYHRLAMACDAARTAGHKHEPAPEPLDPDELAEMNGWAERRGLTTRWNADGTIYHVEPPPRAEPDDDDLDPVRQIADAIAAGRIDPNTGERL